MVKRIKARGAMSARMLALSRKITDLALRMDGGEWLSVEGVVDVRVQGGTFKLGSGKERKGMCAFVHLKHAGFDDGQRALTRLLELGAGVDVRVGGRKNVLFAYMQPFDERTDEKDPTARHLVCELTRVSVVEPKAVH